MLSGLCMNGWSISRSRIGHPFTAIGFVLDNGRRLLVFRPGDLAAPNGESVQHASRHRFETARFLSLIACWQIEKRLAVQLIEIGTDESGFLQPNAVVADEIRDATRRIDLVVRTVVRRVCAMMVSTRLSNPFSITTIRAIRA